MTTTADYIAITIITLLLIMTCFLGHERGVEAGSLHKKIDNLESQLRDLKPVPRINVERASIYPLSGEIIMESIGGKK